MYVLLMPFDPLFLTLFYGEIVKSMKQHNQEPKSLTSAKAFFLFMPRNV